MFEYTLMDRIREQIVYAKCFVLRPIRWTQACFLAKEEKDYRLEYPSCYCPHCLKEYNDDPRYFRVTGGGSPAHWEYGGVWWEGVQTCANCGTKTEVEDSSV